MFMPPPPPQASLCCNAVPSSQIRWCTSRRPQQSCTGPPVPASLPARLPWVECLAWRSSWLCKQPPPAVSKPAQQDWFAPQYFCVACCCNLCCACLPCGGNLYQNTCTSVYAIPPEQLLLWGWRVPFLSSLPIVAIALILRIRMGESSAFLRSKQARSSDQAAGSPLDVKGDDDAECGVQAAPHNQQHKTVGMLAGRVPLLAMLRSCWLPFALHAAWVIWFSSCIYVIYAYVPATVRKLGVMTPLVSYGMAMTSMALQFSGAILGGWAARRLPCMAVCAAAAPLLSAFVLATLAVLRTGSAAGVWAMQNVGLGATGFLLGLHAASFVWLYSVNVRSTGEQPNTRCKDPGPVAVHAPTCNVQL